MREKHSNNKQEFKKNIYIFCSEYRLIKFISVYNEFYIKNKLNIVFKNFQINYQKFNIKFYLI